MPAGDAFQLRSPWELPSTLPTTILLIARLKSLRKVATGTSNKIIASQLGVSEATVKSHLKNILSKLGAKDRTHAVTIAMKRGFIDG